MTEQRRITPEEVLAAYKRHPEIKPERKQAFIDFGAGVCGACALGIMYIDDGQEIYAGRSGSEQLRKWARQSLSHAYISGFMDGFDGYEVGVFGNSEGYADGRAVAAAVFGEMP